jgi:hypothetical protein
MVTACLMKKCLTQSFFCFCKCFFSSRSWVLGFGFCTNCCWGSCWLDGDAVELWSLLI